MSDPRPTPEELEKLCLELIEIVEGVRSLRWSADGRGLRLKDTKEWAKFYVAVSKFRNRAKLEQPPKPDPFDEAWSTFSNPPEPIALSAKETFQAGWDAAIKYATTPPKSYSFEEWWERNKSLDAWNSPKDAFRASWDAGMKHRDGK